MDRRRETGDGREYWQREQRAESNDHTMLAANTINTTTTTSNNNNNTHRSPMSSSVAEIPPLTMDSSAKFKTQYNLAVKYYLHRNFNKSFKLIYKLIEELKGDPYIVGSNLRAKIVKVYFSLVSLLLNEIVNLKVLKLSIPNQSLNFSDFIKNSDFTTAFLTDFNNNGLFNLIEDLQLSDNDEVLLVCFITEESNNLNLQNLRIQIESYLSKYGLYPGPIKTRDLTNQQSKSKILEFYFSNIILKNEGIEKTKDLIRKLFIIDDDSENVEKWITWIEAYDKNIKDLNNSDEDNNEVEDDEDYDYDDDVIYEGYENLGVSSNYNSTPSATALDESFVNGTPAKSLLSSRSLSAQTLVNPTNTSNATITTKSNNNHRTNKRAKKSKKGKKVKKSKVSKGEEEKGDDGSLITTLQRQLEFLKKSTTFYLQKYPIIQLAVVVVLVVLSLGKGHGLNNIQLKRRLQELYRKTVQTARLAFKVSFM